MNKTSNFILELRKALGISQAEMARRVGVVPLTVYRWEKSGKLPRARAFRDNIARLAREVGFIIPNDF